MAQLVLTLAERVLGNEHPYTLTSVNNLALLYRARGRYREAEPLYERALTVRERVLGGEHIETTESVNNLADLYFAQGRYDEAALLYRRILEGRERIFSKEHSQTLSALNKLGFLYQMWGRYSDAESLHQRALEGSEHVYGREDPITLLSINDLAAFYSAQGRYSQAELLYQRALEVCERKFGREHQVTLLTVNNLARLYRDEGRYSKAETLYRRALEALARTLGEEHSDTVRTINDLAVLYGEQGRYEEAEPLYQRALEVRERALGREHPETLASVNNLGQFYSTQGRFGESEPLLRRALEARERVLDRNHRETLDSANNLAGVFFDQARYDEAAPLLKRVLETRERVFGKEHSDTLVSVNNLAQLYNTQGRYSEAEPLFRRSLAARERIFGREHPNTLLSVANLAGLFSDQGRHDEAEPLYKRAVEASERVLGAEHPDTLLSVNHLARLYLVRRDWLQAAQFWQKSTDAIIKRTQSRVLAASQSLTGKKRSEAERFRDHFLGLVKAVHRLVPEDRVPDMEALRETFQSAQWAINSEAAASLAQMAARSTRGDSELAAVVRERQDLVAEWQKRNALRNAALGEAPEKRNASAEAENMARLVAIDARITEIDKRLVVEFPDYAAFASPAALPVEEVQAQLSADEALVLFLNTNEWESTPEETFIWLVTRTDTRWLRSKLGTAALNREVQALRCGLDDAAWTTPTNAARCGELLGLTDTHDPSRPLPFDVYKAHALYQALFGEAEDLLRDKHLLIVPSGPLTQLPFQVLVAAPPASSDHRSIRWLVRDHALTVLPAVSSLKALRRVGHSSAAGKPLIGFGNPLLDGADSSDIEYANLAREKQGCLLTTPQHVAALRKLRSGAVPLKTSGGLANLSHIRIQAPLPETADELCAVAHSIRADPGEMRLGARATEREVKAMSESGDLAQYRIVHFATHGAIAGDLDGTSEPGLILTPPREASAEDDGYLSGSEIASLKLDADWVILSACNTAAGNAPNAEALSGLARAFIYAQARALLVSHWAVDSNATVKLVTAAFGEIGRDPSVGRAEALCRSMLALIDKGDPHEAHPAYWASFIVVGEGAR